MRSFKKYVLTLLFSILPFLAGCSVQLTQADLEGIPQTTEKYSFFGNIPFVYGGDTLELSQKLLKAYTAVVSEKDYPREQCRGVASIHANVAPQGEPSAWAIGMAFIPFWPIQPVNETWTYQLSARIFCNGTLVTQVEFTEQEQVRASLYGKMRSDLVNKASASMHRYLVQRLAYELKTNRHVDQNSVTDY